MRNKLNSMNIFFKKFRYMLPQVLIGIFIMLTISILFDSTYSAIGVLLLLYNVMSLGTAFSYKAYAKDAVILLAMSILATLAGLNMYTLAILNLIVPFLLILLFSDELSPTKYMSYGLFFVIRQSNYPSTLDMLPATIASTVYGLAVLFLFKLIMEKFNKGGRYLPLFKKAVSILNANIMLAADGKIEEIQYKELDNTIDQLNGILYKDVDSKIGVMDTQEEIIFQISVVLSGIDNTIKKITGIQNLNNSDIEYLKKLSGLFEYINQNSDKQEYDEMIDRLADFKRENKFSNGMINNDFRYLLNKLEMLLIKYKSDVKDDISNVDALKLKWIKIQRNCTTHSAYFRFAIKMSIMLCAGFIISNLIPLPKTYWLPCTAFSLIQPYYENTKEKVSTYFLGLILGAVLFMLIFQYAPQYLVIILMTIIFTTMFSLNNNLLRNGISCQLALISGNIAVYTKLEFLELRILLVCFAIILVFIINTFILRTERIDGAKNYIDGLLYKDRVLIKELRSSLLFHRNSEYLYSLLLESYVLQTEILRIISGAVDRSDSENVGELLQYNKKFILEVEKLINIVNSSKLNNRMKEKINETLIHMEKMFMKMQSINNGNYIKELDRINVDYDEEYIENNILACHENVKSMNDILTKNYAK